MRPTAEDPTRDRLNRPQGLAERLRLMRESAGLSGKELAVVVGWHPSKISRLENGRQRPTAADIEAFSRGCGADQGICQSDSHRDGRFARPTCR